MVPLPLHPRMAHIWNFHPAAQRAYFLLGGLCLAEGAAMILSERSRFAGAHWAPVYALGGPAVFGVLFALIGAVTLAAPFRRPAWAWWSLFAGACAHFVLAIVFVTAAGSSNANLLGPVIYVWVGLHFLSHRDLYRTHRKVRWL